MLNPPQSIVLTKLLTEVLTLYDYVLHVLRSAILSSVPFYCKFHFVNRGSVQIRDPFPETVLWIVGFLSVCVYRKHVLCGAATCPVNIPNRRWGPLHLLSIKLSIFVGKFRLFGFH